MRRALAMAMGLITIPSSVSGQVVPEGVHSEAQGPVELCGLTAANVTELKIKVRASSRFEPVAIDSPRFELFATPDQNDQLIFTTSTEPAYPAATCRHMYESGGSLRMNRSMRCEAGRAECDAIFLEFQALDAQMTRALQGRD